jgi:hypothetical protein
VPLHKLLITPTVKSSAFDQFLGLFEVVRGLPFSLTLDFENLGESDFPGGSLSNFRIESGAPASVRTLFEEEFKCPLLHPGEPATVVRDFEVIPFHEGLVWLKLRLVVEGEQHQIEYYQSKSGSLVSTTEWLSPIYIVNKESLRIIELLEKLYVAKQDSG